MKSRPGLSAVAAAALLYFLVQAPGAMAMGSREAPSPPPIELSQETREAWAPVLDEATKAGIPAARIESTVARLDASGIGPEEGRQILEPVLLAAEDGLPPGLLLSKIDEGVLKGALPDQISRAVEGRLATMRRARDLLGARGYPLPPDRGGGLLAATALALESGVPEAAIEATLEQGKNSRPGQVKAVIEAGEALYLEGIDPGTVQTLMLDCLVRNLRRPEIMRVVRFAQEAHRQGMEGAALRGALWGEQGPTGGRSSPRGSGSIRGGSPGGPMGGGMGGPGGGGMGGRAHGGGHR